MKDEPVLIASSQTKPLDDLETAHHGGYTTQTTENAQSFLYLTYPYSFSSIARAKLIGCVMDEVQHLCCRLQSKQLLDVGMKSRRETSIDGCKVGLRMAADGAKIGRGDEASSAHFKAVEHLQAVKA